MKFIGILGFNFKEIAVQNRYTKPLLIVVCALLLTLSGCSTITSAYDSTVDTVSGWFKTDDKKK